MRFSLPLATLLVAAGLLTSSTAHAQWATQRAPGQFPLTDIHFTDANHGYASAAVGELMKTADGGQTWRNVRTGVGSSLRDVYFVTPDTGYVVGNVGVIIGTTDGGQTWTHHDLANLGSSVNGVYFRDGRNGLVTQGDQIWRTTDGGLTWTEAYTYGGSLAIFTFRFLKFTDAATGFAVGGYSGSFGNIAQVVRTMDGGLTWQLLPSLANGVEMGGASAVAFPNARTGYVADVQSRLFRTTDGGDSWEIAAEGNFGALSSLHFTDALTGYGAGYGGNLRRTTDGGQTWQDQSLNNLDTYAAVYFPTPQIGYAAGSLGTGSSPAILKYTAPTGIAEPLSASGISVCPNPSSGVVRLLNLPATEAVQATLYALDGRRLGPPTRLLGSVNELTTRGLAAGLYILRLDLGGRTYQQKLVVE